MLLAAALSRSLNMRRPEMMIIVIVITVKCLLCLFIIFAKIQNCLLHPGLGRNSGCCHFPPLKDLPVEEFKGAGFEPQQPAEHTQRHKPTEETYHLAL